MNDTITKLPNQRTSIEWTSYLATAYAEGFGEGENADTATQIEAWAYLIMTGICWQLQGWFSRNAKAILDSGIISKNGTIDWDEVDES